MMFLFHLCEHLQSHQLHKEVDGEVEVDVDVDVDVDVQAQLNIEIEIEVETVGAVNVILKLYSNF